MIIAIGRSTWTSQCPKQREPIVDDIEGFGLVSEVVLSVRDGFFGGVGVGPAGLIRTGIILIPNSG